MIRTSPTAPTTPISEPTQAWVRSSGRKIADVPPWVDEAEQDHHGKFRQDLRSPVVEGSLSHREALWRKAELGAYPDPAAQRPDDLQHPVAESPCATQVSHPSGEWLTIRRDAWPPEISVPPRQQERHRGPTSTRN